MFGVDSTYIQNYYKVKYSSKSVCTYVRIYTICALLFAGFYTYVSFHWIFHFCRCHVLDSHVLAICTVCTSYISTNVQIFVGETLQLAADP